MKRARTTSEIIAVQVRRWEQQPEYRGPVTRMQRPVITVSSAYGSYGSDIGAMVARLMGFDFFDRELVDRIASSAKVDQLVVKTLDERQLDLISEYISNQFSSRTFTSSEYLYHLCRVVLTIGQHGRAVVLGRGAQYILSQDATLRVRTIAPFGLRVERTAALTHTPPVEAKAIVEKRDADRGAFTSQHFKRDVTDALAYDLVVNTGQVGVEQAATLVVAAFETRFGSFRRADE